MVNAAMEKLEGVGRGGEVSEVRVMGGVYRAY